MAATALRVDRERIEPIITSQLLNPNVVKLEQVPHPQTIFTGDHHTGYVVAMFVRASLAYVSHATAIAACRGETDCGRDLHA